MSDLQIGDLAIVIAACSCGAGSRYIGTIIEIRKIAHENIVCGNCGRIYQAPTYVREDSIFKRSGWPRHALKKIEPLARESETKAEEPAHG